MTPTFPLTAEDHMILERLAPLLRDERCSLADAMFAATAHLLAMAEAIGVYVGGLDHDAGEFCIVTSRGLPSLCPPAGLRIPIQDSLCFYMAHGLGPGLANHVAEQPVYSRLPARTVMDVGSYLGRPIRDADGEPYLSLCVVAHRPFAFTMSHRRLLGAVACLLTDVLARTLAPSRAELIGAAMTSTVPVAEALAVG